MNETGETPTFHESSSEQADRLGKKEAEAKFNQGIQQVFSPAIRNLTEAEIQRGEIPPTVGLFRSGWEELFSQVDREAGKQALSSIRERLIGFADAGKQQQEGRKIEEGEQASTKYIKEDGVWEYTVIREKDGQEVTEKDRVGVSEVIFGYHAIAAHAEDQEIKKAAEEQIEFLESHTNVYVNKRSKEHITGRQFREHFLNNKAAGLADNVDSAEQLESEFVDPGKRLGLMAEAIADDEYKDVKYQLACAPSKKPPESPEPAEAEETQTQPEQAEELNPLQRIREKVARILYFDPESNEGKKAIKILKQAEQQFLENGEVDKKLMDEIKTMMDENISNLGKTEMAAKNQQAMSELREIAALFEINQPYNNIEEFQDLLLQKYGLQDVPQPKRLQQFLRKAERVTRDPKLNFIIELLLTFLPQLIESTAEEVSQA